MEGEYTNAHHDWWMVNDAINDVINAAHDIEPPEGYPLS
jgi:hypothetical protein